MSVGPAIVLHFDVVGESEVLFHHPNDIGFIRENLTNTWALKVEVEEAVLNTDTEKLGLLRWILLEESTEVNSLERSNTGASWGSSHRHRCKVRSGFGYCSWAEWVIDFRSRLLSLLYSSELPQPTRCFGKLILCFA